MHNNHTGHNCYANGISGTLQSFSEKKMSFGWGGLLGNDAQRIKMSKFELQSVLIFAFDARCLPAYKLLSERAKILELYAIAISGALRTISLPFSVNMSLNSKR